MAGASEAELKGLSLGPTVEVFFKQCLEERPVRYIIAWSTGAVATVATFVIACRHAARLRRTVICLQRGYYMRIVAFPVVLGFFAFFNLLCPRAWVLCHLVQGQFEAIAISTFGTILFMLLTIESHAFIAGRADERGHASTADGENAEEPRPREDVERLPGNAARITEALRAQGPRKHFAVPPLGCCWRCLCPEHDLSALHLLQVSWMVRQFAYASVILGAFMMWAALALRSKHALGVYHFYFWALKLSGLAAVYGLMILYLSTKKLLHHWNTTMKFVCIKGVVLISILQELILKLLIKALHEESNSCLLEPGHPGKLDHLVHFWNSYLVTLQSVVFAWLVAKAFPAEEVRDFVGHHLDLVEVELGQAHWLDKGRAAKSTSSEEEDDGASEEESESVEVGAEDGLGQQDRATS